MRFFKKNLSKLTDNDLWDKFKCGNNEAFAELYKRYSAKSAAALYKKLLFKRFNPCFDKVSGVMGEAFLSILEKGGVNYKDKEYQNFLGFFVSCGYNHWTNRYSKESKEPSVQIIAEIFPDLTVEIEFSDNTLKKRIQLSIKEVKNKSHREILHLALLKELNNQRIAEEMSQSLRWVEREKSRGIKALRPILKQNLNGLF